MSKKKNKKESKKIRITKKQMFEKDVITLI